MYIKIYKHKVVIINLLKFNNVMNIKYDYEYD